MDVVYELEDGTQIGTIPGKKSEFDFRVRYKKRGKRERQPKHIHYVVEMYVKHAYKPDLTLRLRDHLLEMFNNLEPINYYPPRLQYFKPEHSIPFRELDEVGEFSVEFLLVAIELILIQEKTNYPEGSLTKKLFENFGVKDRYSVINTAAFRGRG
jgi:hypothetical protein